MRTLPSEAITDLRRRFAYLEAIFGVPDLDLAAAWDSAVSYFLQCRSAICQLRSRACRRRPPPLWRHRCPAFQTSCAMASHI
jgi:hypothetical protein